MGGTSPLQGKTILAVDDEPSVLEVLSDELDMCHVVAKTTYHEAMECLKTHMVDMAVLDIMGVNGFELLKYAVKRDVPAVMLTAHALSMDSLKKSIDMGARAHVPKDKISELVPVLEDVLTKGHRDAWQHLFERLGDVFNATFGSDWKKDIIEIGSFVVPK